jgi:hypothetical protein
MKTKVICGRKPTLGDGKTKRGLKSWDWNRGVVVGPARRRNSLILAALRLIARKFEQKDS